MTSIPLPNQSFLSHLFYSVDSDGIGTIEVVFKSSGKGYKYKNIPAETMIQLSQSGNKGNFISRYVIPNYEAEFLGIYINNERTILHQTSWAKHLAR